MTGQPDLVDRLAEGQVSTVLALVTAAAAADGVAPLSEHGMLRVQHGGPGQGQDALITSDGAITGYGYVEPRAEEGEAAGELVIHPSRRRHGLGTALARALIAATGEAPLRVWAHGDLPAAAALAAAAGFERFRALLQLRRPLSEPLAEAVFPPGTTLRTFRAGQDEQEWLSLNARAFAKHPEQGSWTRRDLELREAEPWFNPDGFFIAERDGAMIGFHWTKVHQRADGGLGEVYVVGVDPEAHGGGIGKALTLAGLRYLREQGLSQVMLYADEDNVAAVSMYQNLGFTHWRTDAMYRRPGQAPSCR
ncbi:MAG TPA: mycothiol synthase [Streptosporangiaceae bacterium]